MYLIVLLREELLASFNALAFWAEGETEAWRDEMTPSSGTAEEGARLFLVHVPLLPGVTSVPQSCL